MTSEPAQLLPSPQSSVEESQPAIGKGWVQAVALVMIFGFLVMGILAYRTYTASMPQPAKVVTENGDVFSPALRSPRGQEIFQARGLQEYGSVLGHGAYLGPDYTADYLRWPPTTWPPSCGAKGVEDPRDKVVADFRTNRYDKDTGTWSSPTTRPRPSSAIQRYYADFFGENSTEVRAAAGRDHRPGADPPADRVLRLDGVGGCRGAARPQLLLHQQLAAEPRVDNEPTAERDRLDACCR